MSSQLNNINTEAVMFQSAGQSIGLHVTLKSVSAANYINFFIDPKARVGIDGFFTVNYPDYADPAGLYQTLVMPGGSQNYDNFSDPTITGLHERGADTGRTQQAGDADGPGAEADHRAAALDPGRCAGHDPDHEQED